MFYIQTCLIIFWYTYRYSIIRANRMELSKEIWQNNRFYRSIKWRLLYTTPVKTKQMTFIWDVFPVCLRYMCSEDKPRVKSGCLCFFLLPLQLVDLRFRLLWLLHLKRSHFTTTYIDTNFLLRMSLNNG